MRVLHILWLLVLMGMATASAQNGPAPARSFDFYVLSLSWSPSFCESRGHQAPRMQCNQRAYSFVVHGLWPQYDRGSPEYCITPPPALDRATVDGMLDLMPAPSLVRHEWKKHGTCAGTGSPRVYFNTVRKARALIQIPPEYQDVKSYRTVSSEEVEGAFIRANPGLASDMISVQCDERRLQEVRICMGKDFRFVSCPEVDRRACRRDRIVMPPVRANP